MRNHRVDLHAIDATHSLLFSRHRPHAIDATPFTPRHPHTGCDVRKEAGNRARLLAASLTVARPDAFDVKCSRLDPPKNFSCIHERDLRFAHAAWWGKPQSAAELIAARDAVLGHRDQATDASWSQPEDYVKQRFVLNLPGQTTGSYSRNLNRAAQCPRLRLS